MELRAFFLNLITILLVALLWSLPSLINGFPLCYYDTSFYLYNAIHLSEPSYFTWRPLTYSYFLKMGLVSHFLFFILLQNGLVASFLWGTMKTLRPNSSNLVFLTFGLLAYLTPLPYVSNFLMPDIFAGLSLVALAAFLISRKKIRWFFLAVGGLMAWTHFSHLLFFIPILFLFEARFHKVSFITIGTGALILLIIRFSFMAPHYPIEKTVHTLIFSRLAHYQIFESYLKENCPIADNFFCKNEIYSFHIWGEGGKLGARQIDDNAMKSIVAINQNVFSSTYAFRYLKNTILQSLEQIVTFSAPMEIVINDASLNYEFHQSRHISSFKRQGLFHWKTLNTEVLPSQLALLYFFVLSSIALVFIFDFSRKKISSDILELIKISLLGYISHALAIGSFSIPMSRYSNRIIWVFSFFIFIHFYDRYINSRACCRSFKSSMNGQQALRT